MNNTIRNRLIDTLWLVGLAIYLFAGVPLVSFHGDETIQIYNTHDYATAFIHGRPTDLIIDFSQPMSGYYLRIHGSSVARYSMGLAWHLAGYTEDDLPWRGWDWSQRYEKNIEMGLRPDPGLLATARSAPTLFLAVSVVIMFGIGKQFGGRPLAYFVSGLFALNPLILMNARRAIQEGPLICFGLLTIYVAILIVQKRAAGQLKLRWWWAALGVATGLVLISKNSGFLYVASAFGWILVAELTRGFSWRTAIQTLTRNLRSTIGVGLRLVGCGLLAIVMLVVFSPGIWGDPITGFQTMVAVRKEQMDIQTYSMGGPSPIVDRLAFIVTQPYLAPLQHSEVRWDRIAQMRGEMERYEASPLSGLHFGVALGLPLTILAFVGLVTMFWFMPLHLSLGVLVWLAVNTTILTINPVLWQRYYVAIVPIMTLLSGLGALGVVRLVRRASQRGDVKRTGLVTGNS